MKSKQFETKDEFNFYINRLNIRKSEGMSLMDSLMAGPATEAEIIDSLIRDGYTDLDNLTADGHGYQLGSHTNNGWIYRDEADLVYITASGRMTEVRERR